MAAMGDPLFLVPAIERLFRSLDLARLVGEAEFARGLQQIEADLMRLALDAHAAQVKGTPMRVAAANEAEFPYLFRAHVGLADLMAMSLPPAAESMVRKSFSFAASPTAEEARRGLVRMAASDTSPVLERALARFILFEGVRSNLLYVAWRTDGGFEAVGGSTDDIDRIAEDRVERLLAEAPTLGRDVRPFRLVIASAMELMTKHAEALGKMVAEMHADVAAVLEECAAFERSLRELDRADELLVRNYMASYLGEQPLSVDELQRQHPVVLGGLTRDALDQRMSRLRHKIKVRGKKVLTSSKGTSLYQLIAEFDEGGLTS
jgi:hypothetical protein